VLRLGPAERERDLREVVLARGERVRELLRVRRELDDASSRAREDDTFRTSMSCNVRRFTKNDDVWTNAATRRAVRRLPGDTSGTAVSTKDACDSKCAKKVGREESMAAESAADAGRALVCREEELREASDDGRAERAPGREGAADCRRRHPSRRSQLPKSEPARNSCAPERSSQTATVSWCCATVSEP
jgi:hypothetical protein